MITTGTHETVMIGAFTQQDLVDENIAYQGTLGISRHNKSLHFLPAFQDAATGETHLSLNRDGSPANVHMLDGLPTEWVLARDKSGFVTAVLDSVVAGFIRDGRFFTRAELVARNFDA